MTDTDTHPPLVDDRLAELLALIREVDSVELKLTVPDSQRRSVVEALEMDPLDAQIRQVWFFDTPDLALEGAGVVVRGRRVQGRGDDSVVKLRPSCHTRWRRRSASPGASWSRWTCCPAATCAQARFARSTEARGSKKRSPDPGP